MLKSIGSIIFLCLVSLAPAGTNYPVTDVWATERVDNSIYGALLQKYVKNGEVDYKGFKKDESKLEQYLKILEDVKPAELSPNEQFAFYINAYNAWTIKLILGAYPGIGSIKDLGSIFKSPWEKEICRINGRILSLDEIEHDILRPRFRDPRVHFAVNCASRGCPPLRSEPYRGDSLDKQLDEMTTGFINNPAYNRIEDSALYVSSIFKWYEEDFDHDIVGFFLKYAGKDLKEKLESNREGIRVKYLKYDWSLNGK